MAVDSPDYTARLASTLEAFAVGDAMGMPTEFMTRGEILERIPVIEGLVDPRLSRNHSDLPAGSITDDTEQNLWLIRAYVSAGKIDEQTTTQALLSWIRESDAVSKRYIGPSSLKALNAIAAGVDPAEAGKGGTTCGGLMRTPSAVVCTPWDVSESGLTANILACLRPTHNTSQAFEAACSYGFALRSALAASPFKAVIEAARLGGSMGLDGSVYKACAASSVSRLNYILDNRDLWRSEGEFLDFLYGVLGTGLESADVFAATLGLFIFSRGNAWTSIRMATSLGGDTDTVAALAGALCAAFSGGHSIPDGVTAPVNKVNSLDFGVLADRIVQAFGCPA